MVDRRHRAIPDRDALRRWREQRLRRRRRVRQLRLRKRGSILGDERARSRSTQELSAARLAMSTPARRSTFTVGALLPRHRHFQSATGRARFHLWSWLPGLEPVAIQDVPGQRTERLPIPRRSIRLPQPPEPERAELHSPTSSTFGMITSKSGLIRTMQLSLAVLLLREAHFPSGPGSILRRRPTHLRGDRRLRCRFQFAFGIAHGQFAGVLLCPAAQRQNRRLQGKSKHGQ
jgi:hypothetical protein